MMINSNGILLVDKPSGLTSNDVLQRVKKLAGFSKAGHTGSLDPLATGMLPICANQATKYSQFLLNADKGYLTTAQLGVITDSGDVDGDVIQTQAVSTFDKAEIENCLNQFRGAILQQAPEYSALKYKGKPRYHYARSGVEIPPTIREVTIRSLTLMDYSKDQLILRVHCSKGTYIRRLVHDIGLALGCGAMVKALHREWVAPFTSSDNMLTLQTIADLAIKSQLHTHLIPIDKVLAHLPEVMLTAEQVTSLYYGQPLKFAALPATDLVRVYDPTQQFLGVAKQQVPNELKAARLIVPIQ